MTPQTIGSDPAAPFGYDDDGSAIAPYGLKADGSPRISNRGRKAGTGFPGGAARRTVKAPTKKTTTKKLTGSSGGPRPPKDDGKPVDYREAAGGLVMTVAMLPQWLGSDPWGLVSRFMGESAPLAMKGESFLLAQFGEPLADSVAGVAAINPWVAERLERMSGAVPMPYMILAKTISQMAAVMIQNWRKPSATLAAEADRYMVLRAQAMARQMEAMMAADQAAQQPAAEPEPEHVRPAEPEAQAQPYRSDFAA